MRTWLQGIVGLLLLCQTPAVRAEAPTTAELRQAQSWVSTTLLSGATRAAAAAKLPFSFKFGDRQSTDFLQSWPARRSQRKLDAERTQHVLTWTDPETGLVVRCVAVQYLDFPTVEWTLYFKNSGRADTPILADIEALDAQWQRGSDGEFLLHHAVGSPANGSDYGPLQTPLGPGATIRIAAAGGRPSNSDLPYFNLQWGGQGIIVVVGWPGQWAAEFARDNETGIRVRAGQELTHFTLHPGEEVRSPLVVVQFWRDDWVRAQNVWRRWMMAHSMPRPAGQLPPPQLLASSSRAYGEMIGANEQNQIMHIDRYLEEGLKLDTWWMDAGWYVQERGWPQVGTWQVDPRRFPHGLKPISDHAHARGLKTLVWFEPERVTPGTWLYTKHPEWLLAKPLDRSNALAGLCKWSSRKLGADPCVTCNPTDRHLAVANIQWQPGRLALHPGPKGQYSVVRWTAAGDADYVLRGAFSAIDKKATTDVHVLLRGQPIFASALNPGDHAGRCQFEQQVAVRTGDVLDLVVGYGNASHACDSTGLEATLTTAAGATCDPAADFQVDKNPNGVWSYGYLAAGPAPDSSKFVAYDQHQVIGDNGWRLLDLGNGEARRWLTDHIDGLLQSQGIDLYRQDFNIDPLPYWRAHDAPDRQGITEIGHVTGYLAYWDELRRRHPDLLIDTCASGGRRNDLETLRRAVPLWRSDYAYEPVGHQAMTYGISFWIPYHGTGTVACADASYYGGGPTPVQPYAFWSNAAPSLVLAIDIRVREIDYATLRRLVGQWRRINPCYRGDYYPLTPYSRKNDAWMAWQFNLARRGEGVVQAFRRGASPTDKVRLKLRGLQPDARYRVTNLDAAQPTEEAGRELMQKGLEIAIAERPGAAVVTYQRLEGSP